MKFADYEFERVCDIEPLLGTDGSLTQFMPQEGYQNARNLPLNKYGAGSQVAAQRGLHDKLPEENASRPKLLDPAPSPARTAKRAKLV